ncbi:MAG: Rne/Rng family ribonuclease [Alphaproteobacteria bacterium]|nr:Rne/Rng family ribonuclease [Alphaproteobacteria bacterium]
MSKKIFIEGTTSTELSITASNDQKIEYFDFSVEESKSKKSNIYLCTVSRVEPSLQAAFVDYGEDRKAFLPFDEIHPSYFKIPQSDKITEEVNATNDDNLNQEKNNKKNFLDFYRKYKIQDVIKKDQVILIQIIKEERGSKGAAVSTFISLPGRYCVLLPNNSATGGVSKKINNPQDRKRLKTIHEKLNLPEGMSLIIRTNATDSNAEDITNDFVYLKKLWTDIRTETLKSKAPKLIYEIDSPLIKIIRDIYNESYEEIIVSDPKTYKEFKKIEKDFTSSKKSLIKQFKGKGALLESYGIKNPIAGLSNTNVYMKSGSYLVINPTEALTTFDINSGKSTSEKNIEITALNTNLEACDEIYNQVVLRNIAGLIVIDFIDMTSNANNFKVEKKMRQLFQNDKSRVQLNKISQFGLMEISRQRVGHSIYEIFFNKCECCDGNGLIKSKNIVFQEITSTIKNMIAIEKIEEINLKIDKNFYEENKDELLDRIKIFLPKKIKINYFCDEKINKYFEFDNNLLEKIAHNLKNKQIKLSEEQIKHKNKENEENEESDIKESKNDNKNYSRKIKKKTSNVSEKKIRKKKREIKSDEIPETEKTYRRKIKKKIIVEKDNTDNNAN